MKAEFTEIFKSNGEQTSVVQKTVELPFERVSARALIVRRSDQSILGTLHRNNGMFALPGGAVEDGEGTLEAVLRELDEEKIRLINPEWASGVAVDYFDGYRELNVWHIVKVDDAEIGFTVENIESKWFSQDENPWYPFMHAKLIMILNREAPDLAVASVSVDSV